MTTVEIRQIFHIADSTLSDWESNPKRKNLLTLLRSMSVKDAQTFLSLKSTPPKFSPKTRVIKLRKEWFSVDLLWSCQDRSIIEINTLISIYLSTPNQDDIEVLIRLFGIDRVKSVLMKLKEHLADEDFREAQEQIEFAIDADSFYHTHPTPSVENILRHPKKRYIDYLCKEYSVEQLIEMAKAQGVPFSSIFQIKKMAGLSA